MQHHFYVVKLKTMIFTLDGILRQNRSMLSIQHHKGTLYISETQRTYKQLTQPFIDVSAYKDVFWHLNNYFGFKGCWVFCWTCSHISAELDLFHWKGNYAKTSVRSPLLVLQRFRQRLPDRTCQRANQSKCCGISRNKKTLSHERNNESRAALISLHCTTG